jgi:hypothetical protein
VGPDFFKVLYLEKHTEIVCYYVLTKLVNGPLHSNTDRVRALEDSHLAADIIWQQDSFHYCNMLPCITGLHLQSPRQFLWQPPQTLRPSYLIHVTAAIMKADGYWHCHHSDLQKHTAERAHDFVHSSGF